MVNLVVICVLFIMYSVAKHIQLRKFYLYMNQSIHLLYEKDRWRTENIALEKSWKRVINSAEWNYNFDNMVIYEQKAA